MKIWFIKLHSFPPKTKRLNSLQVTEKHKNYHFKHSTRNVLPATEWKANITSTDKSQRADKPTVRSQWLLYRSRQFECMLTACQPPTPVNMPVPLIIGHRVTAPFMEAEDHLSNKEQSAHISSLPGCLWTLPRCVDGPAAPARLQVWPRPSLPQRRALIDVPHPHHNCMIQQCPQVQMQWAVRQ